MFRQVRVEILGIVENMSYFECPRCHERTDIFSRGGGTSTAEKYGVPFLGEIPLDTAIRHAGDVGKPVVLSDPGSPAGLAFSRIASSMAAQVSVANVTKQKVMVIE